MSERDRRQSAASRFEGVSERTVAAIRSPRARLVGLLVGAVALVFFVTAAVRTWEDAAPILLGEMTWARATTALLSFAWFQLLSIASLSLIGAHAPARIWAAAQLVKYVPFPGASAVGMLGSSVHYGHSARGAMGLLVRHTLLLIGAGIAVGAFVLAVVPAGVDGAIRSGGIGATLTVGVAIAWASTSSPPLRRLAAVGAAIGAWAGLVMGLSVAFPDSLTPSAAVAASYPAAWVAGLLVLPVPAGLGVREATLLLLLTPVTGAEAAVAFAIATRLLHAVADGGLVAVFTPSDGVRTLVDGWQDGNRG